MRSDDDIWFRSRRGAKSTLRLAAGSTRSPVTFLLALTVVMIFTIAVRRRHALMLLFRRARLFVLFEHVQTREI